MGTTLPEGALDRRAPPPGRAPRGTPAHTPTDPDAIMPQVLAQLAVAIPALAAGVALGVVVGRRRMAGGSATPMPRAGGDGASMAVEAGKIRGQALDVAAEPVLIVGRDGRLRDCNAAALVMLARHRTEVSQADAASLRTLVDADGGALDWQALVEGRAPWSGEAHVRLPDGSRKLSTARVVPVFADDGGLVAMVEVYHGAGHDLAPDGDHFLHVLDADEGDEAPRDPGEAARRELRLLGLAFADLEKLVRQYELLLPAMRAEDPLTEAIAGLAAETSEVAASIDVPRLLDEVPRVLGRLRSRVQRLSAAPIGVGDAPE